MSEELADRAEPRTRAWWESYLKGEASFRGVKMADVRLVVGQLWRELGLDALPISSRIRLARDCMARPDTEDKLAGVLVLAEMCLADLRLRHLPALAGPLADGSLADWNSVDWYCVKVLGPFVVAGGDATNEDPDGGLRPDEWLGHDGVEARARATAGWRTAGGLWQRRAAAVAFVGSASSPDELFPGFHELLLEVAEANTADPTRWSQTSVGWLLRELSRHHPTLVSSFVETHPQLSAEARRNALKYVV